jgi:signal transduction histidine kinase
LNEGGVRARLTIAYVGVFALTLLFLGAIAAFGFSRELIDQQDELLLQEARDQEANFLGGEDREILATGSPEFSWVSLEPDGDVTDADPIASSLSLPDRELARQALEEDGPIFGTVQGRDRRVRVVSKPMHDESGELVGVIQYARSLQVVRDTVGRLALVLFALGIGGLGLSAIGGAYLAGWARRPIRESFERQRSFIADASHELQTPLTLIRADTEVLQRGLQAPGDRELTQDVLAETDRMSDILDDLLLTARLDAGKLPIDEEDFDLAPVIRAAADRFEKRAATRTLRVEVEEPPGSLVARGDPARTGQILGVLLDNALAHTPEESGVTVSVHARDNHVEIVVRDTGPGIPPEHLPRIFERFYRADKARSRASGGTGLGLSIARDLARVQGGFLDAENAEGGGAAFRLELPRAGSPRQRKR